MRAPVRFSAAVVLSLLALAPPAARADKPKLHLQQVDVDKYPLIKAHLSLVESDGRITTGKGPTDFKLVFNSSEQGVAVDAKPFDQVVEPVYVVAVVQVSTAMHEVIDDVKRGVKQLAAGIVDLKVKGSQMALIAYAQDVKRVAEMGKPEAIEGAANAIVEDTEGTEVHLLDAIRTALDLLNAKGVPDKGRRMIVVFSDGIDVQGSDKKGFNELGKRANLAGGTTGNGIVIDTIGFSPFDPTKLRNFAELTKQTNGTDRVCKTAQEVAAMFSNTADEIRKQYVVLFQSVVAGTGAECGIQVLSDSSGSPIYSETVSKICENHAPPPPPPTPVWKYLLWIGGPLLLIMIIFLIVRALRNRQQPEPEIEAPPMSAASPNRTMALDIGVSDKGPTIGWIVGMTGRYTDKTFKLLPARTVIGTAGESDIQLEDPKMSRKHCEIRYDGSTYKIVDLGSTNGIVLNDKRIPSADLVDGDLFRLGGTDFKFKSIN